MVNILVQATTMFRQNGHPQQSLYRGNISLLDIYNHTGDGRITNYVELNEKLPRFGFVKVSGYTLFLCRYRPADK